MEKSIEDVTNAIDAIYERIDACRNSDDGFVARVAEYNNISTHSAMDMIMSEAGEAYEFISDELIEKAVELIMALYWAREYANIYPMPAYNTPSDDEKKYLSALGKAITSAPEKAAEKARLAILNKKLDALPNLLNNSFVKGFSTGTNTQD